MIKKQKGVGLLEVLIAVLVLAVGLLGFAGMQAQAMRANYESLQRAKAVMLANDMFDRMRSNLVAATTTSIYSYTFNDVPPVKAKECDQASVVCSASELAVWDLNEWLDTLSAATNGTGSANIVRPSDLDPSAGLNPRHYRISIRLIESPRLLAGDTTAVIDETTVSTTYDFYAVL